MIAFYIRLLLFFLAHNLFVIFLCTVLGIIGYGLIIWLLCQFIAVGMGQSTKANP
jgi:hypothetical protein